MLYDIKIFQGNRAMHYFLISQFFTTWEKDMQGENKCVCDFGLFCDFILFFFFTEGKFSKLYSKY